MCDKSTKYMENSFDSYIYLTNNKFHIHYTLYHLLKIKLLFRFSTQLAYAFLQLCSQKNIILNDIPPNSIHIITIRKVPDLSKHFSQVFQDWFYYLYKYLYHTTKFWTATFKMQFTKKLLYCIQNNLSPLTHSVIKFTYDLLYVIFNN